MELVAPEKRLAPNLLVPPLTGLGALTPRVDEGVLDPPNPGGIIGVEPLIGQVGLISPPLLQSLHSRVVAATVLFGRRLLSGRLLSGVLCSRLLGGVFSGWLLRGVRAGRLLGGVLRGSVLSRCLLGGPLLGACLLSGAFGGRSLRGVLAGRLFIGVLARRLIRGCMLRGPLLRACLFGNCLLSGMRLLAGALSRYLLAGPFLGGRPLTTGLPGRQLSRPFSRTVPLCGRRFGGALDRRRVLLSHAVGSGRLLVDGLPDRPLGGLSRVAAPDRRRLSGVFPGRRLFARSLRSGRFRRTRRLSRSGEPLRRRRDGRSRSLVSRTMHRRLLRGAIHRPRLLESPGRLIVRTARKILLRRPEARRRHHTRIMRRHRRPPTRRR
ncbi:hypothetical protein OHS58_37095 [Amycolatopsis sp. NBC_00348]|uniref:hypothetical protein n=1 Tax=Amycolatopsis sp. NBC_00348 TaxID=2975956 RepID=UPI002E25E364